MDQILCIIHFCQNQNNHEMFTNSKIMYFLKENYTEFQTLIFEFESFENLYLQKMTLFPSYWEIFHWIMWPFYTNFSHKTNNRIGNIILSFKTLGIKLCFGWSSFVIIKRFKELSNDDLRIVKEFPDCEDESLKVQTL